MATNTLSKSVSLSDVSDLLSHSTANGTTIGREFLTVHNDTIFSQIYGFVSEIGSGGFGTCFVVIDKKKHQLHAAKIQRGTDDREYKIQSMLRNEHVAQVVRFLICPFTGTSCMVMQLYQSNLMQVLKSRRISFHEARDYTQQLVSGLKYVHEQGIVHFDLKPENLLLDDKNNLKICDFGSAMHMPCTTSVIAVTLYYMAPEVLQEDVACSFGVDIWAVGVILYEMLFGYLPFRGRSREIKYDILRNKYEIPSTAPLSAAKLIRNLLNENADSRPSLDDVLRSDFLVETDESSSRPVASIVAPAEEMEAPVILVQETLTPAVNVEGSDKRVGRKGGVFKRCFRQTRQRLRSFFVRLVV